VPIPFTCHIGKSQTNQHMPVRCTIQAAPCITPMGYQLSIRTDDIPVSASAVVITGVVILAFLPFQTSLI
jgi:hypothetical protein